MLWRPTNLNPALFLKVFPCDSVWECLHTTLGICTWSNTTWSQFSISLKWRESDSVIDEIIWKYNFKIGSQGMWQACWIYSLQSEQLQVWPCITRIYYFVSGIKTALKIIVTHLQYTFFSPPLQKLQELQTENSQLQRTIKDLHREVGELTEQLETQSMTESDKDTNSQLHDLKVSSLLTC